MQPLAPTSRDAPAVIILNDTRVDRHHGCSSVMQVLEKGLVEAGFRIAATVPAHSDWAKDAGFQAALPSAQMLVINGEGTLHHDRPAGLRLLQAGKIAHERGLVTALVNAGWEANGEKYVKAVRDFDLISLRDSRSAEALRSEDVECRVVPDLSLCTPAPSETAHRSGVAFTDSVSPDATLALEALRRASAGKVLSIHNRDPSRESSWRFLRSGFGRQDLRKPSRVLTLLGARHAQWKNATPNAHDFLKRIAELELLVSGRFHACTLAMVMRTPFIAYGSNSSKIEALVEDSGVAGWRVNADLASSLSSELARDGWSKREQEAIAQYIEGARAKASHLFRDLGRMTA
jgi:hypothetical protein